MMDISDYYKKSSEQLFIFYISLIDAGFNSDQAFELIKAYVSRSVIENMMDNCSRRINNNRIDYERLRTALRGE